jgi:Ca2+/Na+ antiporter
MAPCDRWEWAWGKRACESVVRLHCGAFAAFVSLYIVYVIRVRTLTRDLVQSSERLTFAESYSNQAASHNLVTLCILEVASLLFVFVGIGLLFLGTENLFIGIACILFFGLCSISIGFMIYAKRSREDSPEGPHT